jgi:rubrerythrin
MRYLAFAERADQEGFTGVAKLFRAAARAEMVHAHSHLRVLGTVKGTKENIKSAIEGETHEFKKMGSSLFQVGNPKLSFPAIR